jgi:hypothetical protein
MVGDRRGHLDPSVVVILEDGHRFKAEADRAITQAKLSKKPGMATFTGRTFSGKAGKPLLQLADILAWQRRKYISDKVTGAHPPRRDFISLIEHPHWFAYCSMLDKEIHIVNDEKPSIETMHKDDLLKKLFTEGEDLHAAFADFAAHEQLQLWGR